MTPDTEGLWEQRWKQPHRRAASCSRTPDPGPGLLRGTQTLLAIVNRSWPTRTKKGRRRRSPQNALPLRLLKLADAFKPANSTLKNPKEIATFSTHEASRLPINCMN